MKKKKSINFRPFEISEANTQCTVHPETGEFEIIVFGKVENIKDYDLKNNTNKIYKFLLTFVFMKSIISTELQQTQDYIITHYKKWF